MLIIAKNIIKGTFRGILPVILSTSGRNFSFIYQKTFVPVILNLSNTLDYKFYIINRNYAKGKDKGKEKKGKTQVRVDDNYLRCFVSVEDVKQSMQGAIEQMKEDFITGLSVRTSSGALESLPLEYDGTKHTLQELAEIVKKNPKLIVINMATFPDAIPAAVKAIQESKLNLNPQQDGTTIFVPVPTVTTEYREILAKNAKAMFIKCKTAIRSVQQKQMKLLERNSSVSEDDIRLVNKQLGLIGDSYIVEAEKVTESKQNELLRKQSST